LNLEAVCWYPTTVECGGSVLVSSHSWIWRQCVSIQPQFYFFVCGITLLYTNEQRVWDSQ